MKVEVKGRERTRDAADEEWPHMLSLQRLNGHGQPQRSGCSALTGLCLRAAVCGDNGR